LIAPDSESPERESFEEVFLYERLRRAVERINPSISPKLLEDALKQIQRLNSPELIANNEAFHKYLTQGINVTKRDNGSARGDYVWLINFENPEKNEFLVVIQFTVVENNVNKRPDVILFVNGIQLVVMELKNAVNQNTTQPSAGRHTTKYSLQSSNHQIIQSINLFFLRSNFYFVCFSRPCIY
jgi:type I restriction enzyme R subunit